MDSTLYLPVGSLFTSPKNPDITSWFFQRIIFSILHLSPFDIIFFSISSNLLNCSDQSPLVIINRLSIYALINYIMQKFSFIFSWKFSGELHTPIGRCLHLYFPHGSIIVNNSLASSFRCI